MPSPDASAAPSASAAPVAPRKPLDLPICSFRGPEVNLPWTERTELPVEQQLEDAVQRIQLAQEERHKLEEEVGSGKYPCLDKEIRIFYEFLSPLVEGNSKISYRFTCNIVQHGVKRIFKEVSAINVCSLPCFFTSDQSAVIT